MQHKNERFDPLPFKYFEGGELVAAFKEEEHLELFKAEVALHCEDLADVLDIIDNTNY